MQPPLRKAQWLALAALAVYVMSAPDTTAASQQQQQSRQHTQACCTKKPLLFQTRSRTDTTTTDGCLGADQHRCRDHLQSRNHCSSWKPHQHCSKQRNKVDRSRQQKKNQKQKRPPIHPPKKHPGKQPVHPPSTEGSDSHHTHSIHSTQHKSNKRQGSNTKGRPNSDKKTRRRSFRKGTFHKKGRIYVLAHQDWYTQYRRQRGPKGVMRKLTLENARRRKAMVTLLPSYTGVNNRWSGGSGSGIGKGSGNGRNNNNTGHDLNNGPDGSDLDNISKGGAEDEASGRGDEGDVDIDLQSNKDDSPDRATGTIQAVRRPTFMGIPEPISYQHQGLIPKSRSIGVRLYPRQREQCLEMCLFVLWVFISFQ